MPRSLLICLVVIGCTTDDEITYVQFNCDSDQASVEIGVDDELDSVWVTLRSTSCGDVSEDTASETDAVVIGEAEIRPGGGPIGTKHEIVVVINDDYENIVDRVSIRTDSGTRGEDEYDLDQDSADEGYYKLSLVTVGEEGETRSDTVTFRIWDEEEEADTEEE